MEDYNEDKTKNKFAKKIVQQKQKEISRIPNVKLKYSQGLSCM